MPPPSFLTIARRFADWYKEHRPQATDTEAWNHRAHIHGEEFPNDMRSENHENFLVEVDGRRVRHGLEVACQAFSDDVDYAAPPSEDTVNEVLGHLVSAGHLRSPETLAPRMYKLDLYELELILEQVKKHLRGLTQGQRGVVRQEGLHAILSPQEFVLLERLYLFRTPAKDAADAAYGAGRRDAVKAALRKQTHIWPQWETLRNNQPMPDNNVGRIRGGGGGGGAGGRARNNNNNNDLGDERPPAPNATLWNGAQGDRHQVFTACQGSYTNVRSRRIDPFAKFLQDFPQGSIPEMFQQSAGDANGYIMPTMKYNEIFSDKAPRQDVRNLLAANIRGVCRMQNVSWIYDEHKKFVAWLKKVHAGDQAPTENQNHRLHPRWDEYSTSTQVLHDMLSLITVHTANVHILRKDDAILGMMIVASRPSHEPMMHLTKNGYRLTKDLDLRWIDAEGNDVVPEPMGRGNYPHRMKKNKMALELQVLCKHEATPVPVFRMFQYSVLAHYVRTTNARFLEVVPLSTEDLQVNYYSRKNMKLVNHYITKWAGYFDPDKTWRAVLANPRAAPYPILVLELGLYRN